MSNITTHVLDISRGRPAAGVPVTLEERRDGGGRVCGRGVTDADGRLRQLLPPGESLPAGTYHLIFDTAAYFGARGVESFYPYVEIVFTVRDAAEHYHVPLLLSPFGYSTYRGS